MQTDYTILVPTISYIAYDYEDKCRGLGLSIQVLSLGLEPLALPLEAWPLGLGLGIQVLPLFILLL